MPTPEPNRICIRCNGGISDCVMCGGSGMYYDSSGPMASSRPFDLKGNLALIAVVAAGLLVIATFVVALTWWMGAGDVVRWVLEHSPLTVGVAETEAESGNPVLVGGVVGALVVGAFVTVSVWRRRVAAARAATGEVPFAALAGVGLLRTLILVFGLTLVPVAASIAAGNDLDPDNETTVLMGVWPIVIVLAGIAGLTVLSTGKRWEAALRKPPPLPPPAPETKLEPVVPDAKPAAPPPRPDSRITF